MTYNEERRIILIMLAWFLFIIYGFPTLFIAMAVVSGTLHYEHADWIIFLWGGFGAFFGVKIRLMAEKLP